jgi:hypothetical protein
MTTFHFHVRAGDELILDYEGADFADYAAALREVTLAGRELLADSIKSGKPLSTEAFVIADGSGKELGTFPLATVLPTVSRRPAQTVFTGRPDKCVEGQHQGGNGKGEKAA